MRNQPGFMKNVLLFDALTCALMGVVLIAAAAPLAWLTAIPSPLLAGAGIVLLPVAAFMVFVGTRPAIPASGVWLVVLGNVAWVAASVALLAGPWIDPNGYGQLFIGAQALVVLVLAIVEYAALAARPSLAAA